VPVGWFETDDEECKDAVSWAVYTRDPGFWMVPEVAEALSPWRDRSKRTLLWTDQSNNLLSVIAAQ
jgi:hypothetical protein